METLTLQIIMNGHPPGNGVAFPNLKILKVEDEFISLVFSFRVFYDVDEDAQEVVINAVRKKPPGKTTEEIL